MSASNVLSLDQANFEREVFQSPIPVVVDFWGEGCGPCKQMSPVLDELAGEYSNRVRVGKVKVEESQELAAQFNVNAIPNLVFFKNGAPVGQIIGMKSRRDLKAQFDKLLV